MLLRFCLLIVTITVVVNCFSQEFLGAGRKVVKRGVGRYTKVNKLKTIITENDSTIVLYVRDSAKRPIDLIYHFNSLGKCNAKTVKADCDSCFKKYVSELLDNKRYKWVKLSETKYVSKFSKHLSLELYKNEPLVYTVRRIEMTKEEYNTLVNTK